MRYKEGQGDLNTKNCSIQDTTIQGSVVRIEVLTFFQANPHTIDSGPGLARRIHRPTEDVEAALDFFTRIGILEKNIYGSMPLYQLRNGKMIASFFEDQRGDHP